MADAAGASRVVGSDARASRHMLEFRRGPQDEVTCAPVVDPHRRSVGAEQPVGAVAEDVEARRQIQRGGQSGRKLVEQRTNVALQFVVLAQAKELERGNERVGDVR